jgi:putative membrane protein
VAGTPADELFQTMERRLLRIIMNPAMIAAWIFGGLLLTVQDWSQGWLHAKLTAVVLITVYHHLLGLWRKDFAAGRNRRPERFYRMVNEIPTLLMMAIVILVIVKPF